MRVNDVDFHSDEFKEFASLQIDEDLGNSTLSEESILHQLNPQREFFTHAQGQAFLLRDDKGKAIGRIYASVDRRLDENPLIKKKIGVFGYFLCQNNFDEAGLLINAAAGWLRERGCEEMHGPMNLNIYNGYRLQTSGFETFPYFGEPRAPFYVATLFSRLGLAKVAGWTTSEVSATLVGLNFVRLFVRSLMRFKNKKPYHFVSISPQNIDRYFADIHAIFMNEFRQNYLYTRVSLAEFRDYVGPLAAHLDSSSSVVLDQNDKAVGFIFNYPNPRPYKGKKILIMHSICLQSDFRGIGVLDRLGVFVTRKIWGRFGLYIGALAKEGPTAIDHMVKPNRHYSMYAISLLGA